MIINLFKPQSVRTTCEDYSVKSSNVNARKKNCMTSKGDWGNIGYLSLNYEYYISDSTVLNFMVPE